jgi:hypothetical protein
MRTGAGSALIVVTLVGGCTPAVEFDDPEPRRTAPAASRSGPTDRQKLMATLENMNTAPFRFSVTSGTPDGGTITATGSADPAGKRYAVTGEITGKDAASVKRVLVGSDLYEWQPTVNAWVHVDMTRVKRQGLWDFDVADPSGLAGFVAALKESWSVEFDQDGYTGHVSVKATDAFLPVGLPAITVLATHPVPFTARVDAQGRITELIVNVVPTNSDPTVKMTTTFTELGAPVQIGPPPKRDTREADASVYT